MDQGCVFLIGGLVCTIIGGGGLCMDWFKERRQRNALKRRFHEFEIAVYEAAKRS